MSDRNETLQELVNAGVEGGMRDIYTSIPAKVVKWDASKGRADCQILIKNVTTSEDLEREVKSWPVVTGVPVEFPGSGDVRITFPIKTGQQATTGRLVFSHRSLDKWLSGEGGEVDPEFDHDHALTDAIFVPGLKPFGAPWQIPDFFSIGFDGDGGLQVRFKDSNTVIIAATEANAQFVALANLVKARLDTIQGAFDGHIHTVAAAPGNTSVPTAVIGALAAVAASKVKAE